MRIHLLEKRATSGWVVFGGYWPRGEVNTASFTLRDGAGAPAAVQSEITARWPDGSVKWSRHIARAESIGKSGDLLPGGEESPEGINQPAK